MATAAIVSRTSRLLVVLLASFNTHDQLGEQQGNGQQPVDISVALVERSAPLHVLAVDVRECVRERVEDAHVVVDRRKKRNAAPMAAMTNENEL